MKKTFLLLSLSVLLLHPDFSWAQKSKLTERQQQEFEQHFMNGAREKLLQNTDAALDAFKACIQIDPNNDAVYYNLAELYQYKRMLRDAGEMIEKAIKLNGANNWYYKLQVVILEQSGEFLKAAKVCEFLSTREDASFNLMQAAMDYERAKAYQNAIGALNKIEKLLGPTEEIYLKREQLYLAMNNLKKATGEVDKLIKAYPENTRYQVLLAELYLVNGKTEKGLQLYRAVLAKDPGNGFAAFALGDYYHQQGEQEKWFEMLKIGMASSDVDIKGKLRMMVGFLTTATFTDMVTRGTALSDIFIQAHPNEPAAYLVKGDIYSGDSMWREAREQYTKALELDPSEISAWNQLIYCDENMKDYHAVQQDCNKALAYFPDNSTLYYTHTSASMQLHDYDSAVWSARKGIEYAGEETNMITIFYSTLGDAYHYLNQFDASDSAYEYALRFDPANAYAMNNYAYFLSLRKTNLKRAEQLSKRSLEIEPLNGSYHDTYGWIMYQQGDYAKAKEHIDYSLKLEPLNAEVIEHLGDVLYKLGDFKTAQEKWQEARKLGEGSKFLDKKLKEGKLYE